MSTNNDHKIKIYLGRMSHLQESILNFINTQGQAESQYQEIISFFKTHKIGEDRNELQSILHLILKISNNHHRNPDFFSKIERLFTNFKEEMKIYFSNYEIFKFFKSNKRLLLFLFKEGIIKPDKQIACFITNYKYQQAYYPHFFLPEFKNLFDEITLKNINETIQTLNQNQQTQVDDKNSFDQKRQIGENDHILYELIRNDSIDQFTSLVTEKNLPLSSTIEPSIFETNSFLINQNPTLIEYAVFFGSLKIFNFLRSKEIELTPSLWNFAIHGENLEILKILVDKKINPQNDSFKDVFIESIKCHHNQIAKLIQINKKELNLNDISTQSIKYYNYSFFPTEIKCDEIKTLCDFCKYNYFQVVSFLLESNKIPINSQSRDSDNIAKTPLQFAVEKENTSIVILLLKNKNVDVNVKAQFQSPDGQLTKNALYMAVEKCNSMIVFLLLSDKRTNINEKFTYLTKQGQMEKTALHLAVEKGNSVIVQLLLSNKKINVNMETLFNTKTAKIQKTALHIAIEKGNAKIVKLLLSNDEININAESKFHDLDKTDDTANEKKIEKTALHIACEKGNLDIIRLLLEHNAINVNIKSRALIANKMHRKSTEKTDTNSIEKTALYIATEERNVEAVKLLLSHKNINVNIESQFLTKEQSNSIIQKVMEAESSEDTKKEPKGDKEETTKEKQTIKTPLHIAVEKGILEIVHLLLSHPSINFNIKTSCHNDEKSHTIEAYAIKDLGKKESAEKTALHIAIESGNLKIIQDLLSFRDVDVNIKSSRKFNEYRASKEYKKKTKSATEEEYEKTPLYIASENCNADIVKLLLERKDVDINDKSVQIENEGSFQRTALHIALEKQNTEIVSLILANANLDISVKSTKVATAKDLATRKKDNQQEYQKAPLFIAVEEGNSELVKLLLANPNIDVNEKSVIQADMKKYNYKTRTFFFDTLLIKEQTALHEAVQRGNLEIIKLLVNQNGIDVNAEDHKGQKPIDFARNEEIKKILNEKS